MKEYWRDPGASLSGPRAVLKADGMMIYHRGDCSHVDSWRLVEDGRPCIPGRGRCVSDQPNFICKFSNHTQASFTSVTEVWPHSTNTFELQLTASTVAKDIIIRGGENIVRPSHLDCYQR